MKHLISAIIILVITLLPILKTEVYSPADITDFSLAVHASASDSSDDGDDVVEWTDFTKLDINYDGNIDTLDLSEVKKILLGSASYGDLIGDIDNSGKVDLLDLITFKRYFAGEQIIPEEDYEENEDVETEGGDDTGSETEDKKEPVLITYEEYLSLTPAQQQEYCESFQTMEDFGKWFVEAKKEYEDSKEDIDVDGNGNLDLDDYVEQP